MVCPLDENGSEIEAGVDFRALTWSLAAKYTHSLVVSSLPLELLRGGQVSLLQNSKQAGVGRSRAALGRPLDLGVHYLAAIHVQRLARNVLGSR